MIRRDAEKQINDWIDNGKDALLITGARQIGKTYLIRNCLKEKNIPYIELNFIENSEYIELFSKSFSSKDIIMRLSLIGGEKLIPGKTVIFLDEVQECKELITAIKFLVEDGSFKYILSGSLLGIELSDLKSAPVGYMSIFDMYPLSFKEFIKVLGVSNEIIDILKQSYKNRTEVDTFIHNKLIDLFNLYLIVGGMPEAVSIYIETNNLEKVSKIHEKIIRLYKQDFSKYEVNNKLKLKEIYDAMPSQLDQKNKRFRLNVLGDKMNYDRVENSFLWLKDAGVAIPVYNLNEPKLPFILNENRSLFKLFFSDVGLLTSQYSLQTKMAILNKEQSINNGSLFENAVAQELLSKGFKLYYFNSKKQGELDFLIELDGEVLPIEVKSGKDYKKHSALNNVMNDLNYDIPEAYILNQNNIEIKDKLIYLPIYMLMFIENDEIKNPIYKLDLKGLM
ncbi:MAG: AAA family ATPase [Erysipelotrichaceae bacterium]|nr:AAA family ATPase [Erysipelotrichaceae bacterium]